MEITLWEEIKNEWYDIWIEQSKKVSENMSKRNDSLNKNVMINLSNI